ncbi:MAG: 50S ribosomal protein L10 [Deltaproteobacteria bacterium]|nr:MAG: 50S ribosomal protein L10 [Deltaproteobacteria bacterium]
MNQFQKEKQIRNLNDIFTKAQSLILMEIDKLKTSELVVLRRSLKEHGVGFKVVKNKVARVAMKYSFFNFIEKDFLKSTAIVWSRDDLVVASKLLMKYQETRQLKLRIGYHLGEEQSLDQIINLSKLPDKKQIRMRLVKLIQGSIESLLLQIHAPASNMLGVIRARAN